MCVNLNYRDRLVRGFWPTLRRENRFTNNFNVDVIKIYFLLKDAFRCISLQETEDATLRGKKEITVNIQMSTTFKNACY